MRRAVFALAAAVLAGAVGVAVAEEDPRLLQGRSIAAEFQQALKERLSAALAAGGPVQAIEVCRLEAPAIAERLSARSGTRVGRTALRLRNPANVPDAAARAVLEDFAGRTREATAAPAESFATAADGSARYMRAILTQPPCLSCHGSELAPEVKAALAQRYPADAATGFAPGQLRGAFIIQWPSATVPETSP